MLTETLNSLQQDAVLNQLRSATPVFWQNTKMASFKDAAADVGLTQADVDAAMARLQRFAPYIQKVFPETQASNGIIESEFYRTERLRKVLGIEKGRCISKPIMSYLFQGQ